MDDATNTELLAAIKNFNGMIEFRLQRLEEQMQKVMDCLAVHEKSLLLLEEEQKSRRRFQLQIANAVVSVLQAVIIAYLLIQLNLK